MNDALRQLYQSIIIDHGRAPRHAGPLPGATHEATADNPLCGDQVTLRLVVEGDLIQRAAFEGRGCSLSQAAASLMASRIPGTQLADAAALATCFAAFVQDPPGTPVPPDLGDLAAFAGVREFRSRQTCATLVAEALLAALKPRA